MKSNAADQDLSHLIEMMLLVVIDELRETSFSIFRRMADSDEPLPTPIHQSAHQIR
jgi:hypothetical protein